MDSCYEIIPLLARYANHLPMGNAELTKVRLHLIECDQCRMTAVPTHARKPLGELWPAERIPAAPIKVGRGLATASIVGSVLLHLLAAVGMAAAFHSASRRDMQTFMIDSRLQGSVERPVSATVGGGAPGRGEFPRGLPNGSEKPGPFIRNNASSDGSLSGRAVHRDIPPEPGRSNRHSFEGGGISIGGAGFRTNGRESALYDSAEDLLTVALAGGLDDEQHTVVWLVDRTPSMLARRDAIVRMIRNSFAGIDKKTRKNLQMTVVAFGREVEPALWQQTGDVDKVIRAIRSIRPDRSGTENTGAALQYCANRYPPRKSVRIILFTDEQGDDLTDDLMEEIARRMRPTKDGPGTRLYVVCDEVPFGAPEPGRKKGEPWSPGAETAEPEALGDWGEAIPVLRAGAIGSGFGPYKLAHLAAATRGRACLTTVDTAYNLDDLADVRPSMLPPGRYRNAIRSSRFRATVSRALRALRATPFPRRKVLRNADEIRDERKKTDIALQAVLHWLPIMEKAVKTRVKEKRWRANGDLLLAQLTTAKYYLAARRELLRSTGPIRKGRVLAFRLSDKIPAGLSKVRRPANRLKRWYRSTPWARVGKILANLKSLQLKARRAPD